jgi:hypothetical protein
MTLSENILRRSRFLLASLALVAGAQSSLGADPSPPIASPQPAVRQYLAALKSGDLDAAMKLTATIKDLPQSQVRQGLATYSETLRAQEVESKIHDARATEDCAVVIIEQIRPKHQTQPSLMPVMLVRQGKDWKVLPRLNAEQRKTALTEAQLGSVKALGKWFYQKIGEIETRSRDDYGKPLPIEAKSLVGVWSRTESGTLTLLAFNEAGDFDETIISQGKLTARLTGKWSVADKMLKLSYNEAEASGAKRIPDQRIYAIMRNILGLETEGEGKRIWQRVPDERRRKLLDELEKRKK